MSASSIHTSIHAVHPSSGFIGGHVHRMESEHLRLRQANQDLLQRLRVKQEEIRKSLPSKPLLPASLCNRATAEASVPLPKRGVCVRSVLKVLSIKWASYGR